MAWFNIYRWRKDRYQHVMSVFATGKGDAISFAVRARGHCGFEAIRRDVD